MRKLIQDLIDSTYSLSAITPLTNVYGLGRSLLALSTFSSLLFNNVHTIFKPVSGIENAPVCVNEAALSFFCIFSELFSLEIAKIFALFILFLVVIGFYPRYTCVLHYWIVVSFAGSATVIDGGDQVNTVLSFLLIPVCIFDSRRWVWNKIHPPEKISLLERIKTVFLWSCFFMLMIQVSIIYLNASIAKLKLEEWRNGTAIYYFFNSPTLGMSKISAFIFDPIINNPVGVTFMTFFTLFFELMLFCSIFMAQRIKYMLFVLGIFFHFMIILVHGLPTFFLSMSAALVFLLIPKNLWLHFPNRKLKTV
ncbi:sporulation-delaying protein SdpB family protein [Sinomicrobium sp. M5D2P17]